MILYVVAKDLTQARKLAEFIGHKNREDAELDLERCIKRGDNSLKIFELSYVRP